VLAPTIPHTAAARDRLRGVRVLFVLPSLGLGGAERQAFYFARHLRHGEGADVRLVGMARFDAMSRLLDQAGLPYEFFEMRHGYRNRLQQLLDLRRWISFVRARRAEIVLPYCMFQNILCGLTWRLSGARLCIWNQRDEGRSRLEPWIERLAVGQMPCFVSNSTHGATFVIDQLKVAPPRVHVVWNGIEVPDRQSGSWRTKLDLPTNTFLACMVANLHGKKDHRTLISAWRQVVDRFPAEYDRPHLVLAGADGDQSDALRRQVSDASLGDLVHFAGEVRDVGDLLSSVDLAVFSSFAEGIPNAVLEAMSHGRAVVATDYPGIREAVGPDTGWLTPPQDAEALAAKILEAALNPAERQRRGAAGRVRAVDHFGMERMTQGMTEILLSEWRRIGGGSLHAAKEYAQ